MAAPALGQMVRNSGPDPAGTKRTADVDVKSLADGQTTKLPDGNLPRAGTPAYERVRPRMPSERGHGPLFTLDFIT